MTNRPLIDREIFFDNPEIGGGQLSPDGKHIAFMKAYNGIMNIYVKGAEESFDKAILLTESESPILGFFWSIDSQFVLYLNDKNGDENINIFAVKPSEADQNTVPNSRNITDLEDVYAQIYHVSRQNAHIMWVGLNDRDKAWHDLYKLNISTGERELLYTNEDRITGWEFDWDEQVRLAYRTDENGFSEILNCKDYQEFKLIYKTNLKEAAYVKGWNEDNSLAYLISNKGEMDLGTLYLMNPENGEVQFVENDPESRVDIADVFLHRHTRKLICTLYVDDKMRRYWKDESWRKAFESIESQFPNRQLAIESSTYDYDKLLLVLDSDIYATEVYLYDFNSEELTHQYTPRPKLKEVETSLSPMNAIAYPSSDGLKIPAYLTTPRSAESSNNLPCVVLVHGGPKGPRDYWGYNPLVQFLADRGYAVLQPNFRASGGYGKAFLNAGDLQWGKLMQDDITYGVKYLINEGIIDKNRVAIMGGSYGGYATLAGLAFTPELYTCGVDIVGPSNLFTLLDSIPPYWEAGRKWLYEMTGDPNTEEGQKRLKESSPLFHVDNMVRPLLIVQGANDPRVKKAESDQIVDALKAKGHDVDYLLALDEGHGFRKPLNRMAMYAEIEKFFHKHLGGPYQKEMPEAVENTLELLRVGN